MHHQSMQALGCTCLDHSSVGVVQDETVRVAVGEEVAGGEDKIKGVLQEAKEAVCQCDDVVLDGCAPGPVPTAPHSHTSSWPERGSQDQCTRKSLPAQRSGQGGAEMSMHRCTPVAYPSATAAAPHSPQDAQGPRSQPAHRHTHTWRISGAEPHSTLPRLPAHIQHSPDLWVVGCPGARLLRAPHDEDLQ
jgi:hypothetical protein